MLEFYKGKKVLVTGHTGFKGSWLCGMLYMLGAEVVGYSLCPPTDPNLFTIANIDHKMKSYIGDILNFQQLKEVFELEQPQIVFHLAAQPIVRESYKNPRKTYETNVMGTVNILECVRESKSVKSFLNVTTDKVYENREWEWGYREIDPLDGFDPYSNSKSCSELVTHSYKKSFFAGRDIAVSTARAGNVIGGGDFAEDRILPDCIRYAMENKQIELRNPNSVRPYQHVLEALSAYLQIAEKQAQNLQLQGYYNVGPDESDCVTTGQIADLFCSFWGENVSWRNVGGEGPHEANFLKLDSSKIRQKIGWKPFWNIEEAVEKTVAFAKAYKDGISAEILMKEQINEFLSYIEMR